MNGEDLHCLLPIPIRLRSRGLPLTTKGSLPPVHGALQRTEIREEKQSNDGGEYAAREASRIDHCAAHADRRRARAAHRASLRLLLRLANCSQEHTHSWRIVCWLVARGQRAAHAQTIAPHSFHGIADLAAVKTLANRLHAVDLARRPEARAEKASIPQSLRAAKRALLLRDLRQRRVEEVVDRNHAVALVERVQ